MPGLQSMFSENCLATQCFSVMGFSELREDRQSDEPRRNVKTSHELDWVIEIRKDNRVNTF